MSIRLVPPAGFSTSHGGDFSLGDGYVMRRDPGTGDYLLPDDRSHFEPSLLHQGFKRWEPPKPKRIFKDQFEQAAVEKPLLIPEILALCESEQVRVRVFNSDLEIRPLRGDLSRGLLAHLEVHRAELRNHLERQAKIPWRKV